MKKLLSALALLAICTPALAHEGHDHDAPTTIQAPKGGVIKALDESRVEVTSKGKDLNIFLYDKELKPLAVTGFKVKAKAQLPRGKKEEEIQLIPGATSYTGVYDAKGAHRYTLLLSVTDPKTARSENLSFTIEPRK